VSVSAGVVPVSYGKVTVEVTYSVDAEMDVTVGVPVDAVTVKVIYSVEAESVIVVNVSVEGELVCSPPGVLTDEAGTLCPQETVPVPQLQVTLEQLLYGGVADGT
jgi:hypothetical protein